MSPPLTRLYLDLLQCCLTRYGLEGEWRWEPFTTRRRGLGRLVALVRRALLDRRGIELMVRAPIDQSRRFEGLEHSPNAETMIGLPRLENLRSCLEDVLARGVPGDLIETGAWRGGACIFMRAVLGAHGVTDRTVWVADSFAGLPKPDPERYPSDLGDDHWRRSELVASLEQVEANFRKYGLLDDQVRFLVGWFKDTLPTAPIERVAVLRLDGDMYESTIQALDALYPKLSRGGYVIVDDYGAVEGCRQAVEDFRRTHGITDPVRRIDWGGVFWQRS